MTLTIAEFDDLRDAEAAFKLAACCGASRWVAAMLKRRPFGTRAALLAASDDVARLLQDSDWLEAFAYHPRIGQRRSNAAVSTTAESWSIGEQSAVSNASTEIRAAIKNGNDEYEQTFGFIFIISAAGRSAEQILAALRERMSNSPNHEIRVAAREQQLITRLRLEKLVEP